MRPDRNQLRIPVEKPGDRLSPEDAYADEFGWQRLAEQKRLAALARACNCGNPYKPPGLENHKPGCPLARKRR